MTRHPAASSDRLRALRHEGPRRLDVPGMALATFAKLTCGVAFPALTFDDLFDSETFSVLSGIQGFVTGGNLLLALLVVFPMLDALASPAPRAGMWLLLTSGALTAADSRLCVRTAGERRPS